MIIKPEMLDELTAQRKTPEDIEALCSQLLQRMINRRAGSDYGVRNRGMSPIVRCSQSVRNY